MKNKILIIDDDEKLLARLQRYLEKFEYKVYIVANPIKGLEMVSELLPDLIILDVMLPEIDGFETLRKLRKKHEKIPVIMLTARGDVTERIVGLELGADDYLPKPFEPRELVARIQTVLRRINSCEKEDEKELIQIGQLEVNFRNHQVKLKGNIIDITHLEFQLLSVFIQNRGRVLDRNFLLDNLRGMDWENFNRSVDVLISRLRQKLKEDPKIPKYIKTVWGSGYMFLEGE